MVPEPVPNIDSFGLTHIGNVREENQDAIRLCDPGEDQTMRHGHLYALADGMGGYSHGGTASTLALTTFFDTVYASNGVPVSRKLRNGVQTANLHVYQIARKIGVSRMGTTLTALNIIGSTLFIAHVGDSRTYLIRDGRARCLTKDHTRVGELVRMKLLTADKVRSHSQRSVLNKCLGLELFVQPDVFPVDLRNGDKLILCCDGVWSVIEDEEFADIATRSSSAEESARKILKTALERASDDNVSVISLEVRKIQPAAGLGRFRGISLLFQRFSSNKE